MSSVVVKSLLVQCHWFSPPGVGLPTPGDLIRSFSIPVISSGSELLIPIQFQSLMIVCLLTEGGLIALNFGGSGRVSSGVIGGELAAVGKPTSWLVTFDSTGFSVCQVVVQRSSSRWPGESVHALIVIPVVKSGMLHVQCTCSPFYTTNHS
jgi:hypothetical protein